jgi:alginate O-acetyltransferase complex protein AlgI
MVFNSFEFFIFFIVISSLYFIVPYKFRWVFLLLASCYFYMAFIPYYMLILAGIIVIDYSAGIAIENARTKKRKKQFLILSLLANIGVLMVFKYYNFFIANIETITGHKNTLPYLSLLLPIGLSFHTFQSMSYTIEIYRGQFKAEKHFGIYALYVMFYPQLVAGPIERPQHLLPQFRKENKLEYNRIIGGLKRMLWGFFKKIVIADRLALIVDYAYHDPQHLNGSLLLVATYLFAFQIYCDFSGYSDIAIGAAKVMGYDLVENFRTPYLSKSVKEFWARWHISLSSWFREYVYKPLGGNRVSKSRWYVNVLIVFMISGLWHGANLTFLIWGALHAVYFFVFSFKQSGKFSNSKNKLIQFLRIGITFNLIAFAWIFFRADTLTEARLIISKLMVFKEYVFNMEPFERIQFTSFQTSVLLLIVFVFVDPLMDKLIKGTYLLKFRSLNIFIFACIAVLILLFGYFGKTNFIYFQF